MEDTNSRKTIQLGMPFGTACAKLRKLVLFDLLKRYNENVCYRCKEIIDNADDLSIEHKKPWLDNDVNLFWDMDNISFSHLRCNVLNNRQPNRGQKSHGVTGYTRHNCRCSVCREAQRARQARIRLTKKSHKQQERLF